MLMVFFLDIEKKNKIFIESRTAIKARLFRLSLVVCVLKWFSKSLRQQGNGSQVEVSCARSDISRSAPTTLFLSSNASFRSPDTKPPQIVLNRLSPRLPVVIKPPVPFTNPCTTVTNVPCFYRPTLVLQFRSLATLSSVSFNLFYTVRTFSHPASILKLQRSYIFFRVDVQG